MLPNMTIDIEFYSFFNFIAIIAMFIANFAVIRSKKYNLSKPSKALIANLQSQRSEKITVFAEMLILTFVELVICAAATSVWAKISTNTSANYFGIIFFYPILFFLICRVLSIDPLKQLDDFTPGICMNLIFAKVACFFCGCCYGFEMDHSFYYSVHRERWEFPVQGLECLIAVGIFVTIVCVRKKGNMNKGTLFPLFMILYSGTRFFSEFCRADFAELIFGLKNYQFQCIAGVIIGIAEWYFVRKYQKNKERIIL